MTQPIELYFWPTPNGHKITIALEEMNLPYTIHYVNIGKGDQFAPDFLKIAPNNKMPAIVDPVSIDGEPLSLFESGAILQYLARKTGLYAGETPRQQAIIEQWLMWQMGGLGPMAGQAHHFLNYAPEDVPYGKKRYKDEVNRLYGVLNKQLEKNEFVAGAYSIADMAIYPWARLWENQAQDIAQFPAMKDWLERVATRPGVERGMSVGKEAPKTNLADDKEAQKILFGQRAG
ncbi:glutathione S-transferase N-terminal domain-containing protein [Parvularcula marina]|uniref:Glutathione S-transferase family protein n=1 Tax=Parvularcula marina TaxID=2292771 RepID=A0A371RHI8_9PROT|nr:glutathione S-transferase N-terminal domain-containing protein [Parvularcula marina]RFB04895.1 glutathione S-transferase family protein [Parvularcula marina]